MHSLLYVLLNLTVHTCYKLCIHELAQSRRDSRSGAGMEWFGVAAYQATQGRSLAVALDHGGLVVDLAGACAAYDLPVPAADPAGGHWADDVAQLAGLDAAVSDA